MARRSIDVGDVRDLLRLIRQVPLPPGGAGAPAADVLDILARLVPSDLVMFNDLAPRRRGVFAEVASRTAIEFQSPPIPVEIGFWDAFWTSAASHPDRTGDFVSPSRLSDFMSLRDWRRSAMRTALRPMLDFDRQLLLPLPGPPGHSRRLRFIRLQGRDFDDGDCAVAALIRPHAVAHLHAAELAARGVPPVTSRQSQLLALIALGYTNQQISRTLGITVATVRTHLHQIYTRLGVGSRGEAVALLTTPGGLATGGSPGERRRHPGGQRLGLR